MALLDAFMIVFIWMWGQSAPVALKVMLTIFLAISTILRLVWDFILENEK